MAKKPQKSKKLKETAAVYYAAGVGPAALPTFNGYITTKGQVVIPAALRKKYNITPETKLMITDDDGRIIIQPIDAQAIIESLRGCLADTGTMEDYLAEKRKERELENAKFNRP
jgi:AbrB family looped-hinge helix DNA binding protein